jgi:hypothetical protein
VGLVSRVRRANDLSLEAAILVSRVLAVLAALADIGVLVAFIWTDDWRWLATAIYLAALAVATGWFGWWIYGNAEWGGRGRR